jgi:hypothetical protein
VGARTAEQEEEEEEEGAAAAAAAAAGAIRSPARALAHAADTQQRRSSRGTRRNGADSNGPSQRRPFPTDRSGYKSKSIGERSDHVRALCFILCHRGAWCNLIENIGF